MSQQVYSIQQVYARCIRHLSSRWWTYYMHVRSQVLHNVPLKWYTSTACAQVQARSSSSTACRTVAPYGADAFNAGTFLGRRISTNTPTVFKPHSELPHIYIHTCVPLRTHLHPHNLCSPHTPAKFLEHACIEVVRTTINKQSELIAPTSRNLCVRV